MKYLLFLSLLPFLAPGQPTQETLRLQTANGQLEGTLTLPQNAGNHTPLVIIIAGSGPTDRDGNNPMGVKAASYRLLAEDLARKGIAAFRYDKRGIAASGDAMLKEADLRFDTYVNDAVRWADTLRRSGRFGKQVIAGHSEGSLIGMLAAGEAPVQGFISLAGPGRGIDDILKDQLAGLPDSLKKQADEGIDKLKKGEEVARPHPMLMSILRPSVQPYMISWMRYRPTETLKKLRIPVLIIQGERDLQVPASEAKLLKDALPTARLVLFGEMNHILKDSPADQGGNMATYMNPDLPLTPGLTTAIEKFVKEL